MQDDVDPEITKKVMKPAFTVEKIPLKFIRSSGNFLHNPAGRRLTHMSMCEMAFPAWRNGKTVSESLQSVDYSRGGYITSSLPGWTDTIDNIPRLTTSEKIYTDKLCPHNKRPLMLRPEQKSEALMMTLVEKYSQPGDLVFDPFGGALTTGRACLLLNKHRRCIVSDNDTACFKYAVIPLVTVFAKQLLNPLSDITGTDELKATATFFLQRLQSIVVRRFKNTWNVSGGKPLIQVFPTDILHFVSSCFRDFSLYNYYRSIPYHNWVPLWRSRLNKTNPEIIMAHELSKWNLELRPSSIPNGSLGVFTST